MDNILEEIKNEQADRIRNKRVIAIVETDGQFVIERWSDDSVWPNHEYPTKQKAAARILQLLGLGPTAPQTWPEEVCIGNVTLDPDA